MDAIPSPENDFHAEHVTRLLASYSHWTGRPLLADATADAASSAEDVFRAPFVVLSHNTDTDPLFNYGNETALALFELSWSELIGLPSRYSAEPVNRAERERLLATVSRQGFIDDYQGVRISARGKRFLVPSATVWNVLDEQGQPYGQAATFTQWSYL